MTDSESMDDLLKDPSMKEYAEKLEKIEERDKARKEKQKDAEDVQAEALVIAKKKTQVEKQSREVFLEKLEAKLKMFIKLHEPKWTTTESIIVKNWDAREDGKQEKLKFMGLINDDTITILA